MRVHLLGPFCFVGMSVIEEVMVEPTSGEWKVCCSCLLGPYLTLRWPYNNVSIVVVEVNQL